MGIGGVDSAARRRRSETKVKGEGNAWGMGVEAQGKEWRRQRRVERAWWHARWERWRWRRGRRGSSGMSGKRVVLGSGGRGEGQALGNTAKAKRKEKRKRAMAHGDEGRINK